MTPALRRLLRRFVVFALATFLVLAIWAFWWEPRRLVVREAAVDLPCWTAAPLRIALVSDIHVGAPGMGMAQLDRLVRVVNEARPDVVLLLGDFVIQGVKGGRFVPPETIARQLAGLRAPLGTFAVLGNHDWWFDGPRVARAFTSAGIRVVDDAAVRLRDDRPFWLVGFGDFWHGQYNVAATLASVTDAAPVVAMTHNPDLFPALTARPCLTVAGHTHGGQVAVPIFGRPVVPSRYGERYAVGHVQENGRHLYVTSGVGTSILPVRFRVPPEIVVLRLQGGS